MMYGAMGVWLDGGLARRRKIRGSKLAGWLVCLT